MTDRTVRVWLQAVVSGYQAKMGEAAATTKALESRVTSLHGSFQKADLSGKGVMNMLSGVTTGSLATGAAVAVATGMVVKFAAAGVRSYVALVDQVRNFQRVTGASAEQSSIMVARANALRVSTDTLANGMFRLSQNVEINASELAAHNVEIKRNQDGSVNLAGTLDSVSAAWRRAGAGQEANRITQLAFGRGAVQLLPILAATKERIEGIDAAARQHHELITDQDIRNVIDYKIATHDLSEAWSGLERNLAQGLVPTLTETFGWLVKVIDAEERGKKIVTGVHIGPMRPLQTLASPGGAGIRAGTDLIQGHFVDSMKDLFNWHNKNADAAKTDAEREQQFSDALDAQAVQEYADTLDSLVDSEFGFSAATDKFGTGLAGAYTQLKQARDAGDAFAASLATSSTTGLRNRAMLQGLEADLGAAAKAYKKLHPQATDEEIRQALQGQIGQLQVLLGYFSGDVTEAQHLRDVLNEIAGKDLSRPGKTYNLGFGIHLNNPFAATVTPPAAPAPPVDSLGQDGQKADSSSYLESLFERRMQQAENRFKAGRGSLAEYDRVLDEAMAHEVPWTDRWVELQQKKADAAHFWTDAVTAYLKALSDQTAEFEDNMFTVGDLSTDQYLDVLQRRLVGLQKYSAEWTRVYQEIQQLQGDALDGQIKLIEAVEAQRQFDVAYYSLADQRALNPMTGTVQHHAAGGFVTALPGVTGDNVPMYATAGEFVLNRDASKRLGPDMLRWLNAGMTPASRVPYAPQGGGGSDRPAVQFHSHMHVDRADVPWAERRQSSRMRGDAYLMGL